MTRQRRSVLKLLGGAASGAALAGCIDEDTEGENGFEFDPDEAENGESDPDSDESDAADDDNGRALDGRIEIWHELSDGEATSFDDWTDSFEETTGTTVSVSEVGHLEDRVETAVASGEGPEMWTWAHDWAGNHWDRGFLADVSDDLTIDIEEEYADAAAEAVQPPGTGAVVGLPSAGETMTLFYNPELIDEPPETFEDVIDIAQEFHDPQAGEYGFTQDVNVYTISWALQAFGSRIFEVDGNGDAHLGLEEQDMHRGMALFQDLYDYMPRDLEYDPQISTFASGNAPLHFNGPWAVTDFNNQNADFEVTGLPEIDGGEATPFTGIDVWYFSDIVNYDESRKEAAIEFAEWFTTTDEIIEYYADEHAYIPVVDNVDEATLPQNVQGFYHAFEQGVPMPVDSRMNQVWRPFEDAITAVLTNDAAIGPAFADAAESIRDSWD